MLFVLAFFFYLDYFKKQDLTCSLGTNIQNCPGNMTSNVYVTCFFFPLCSLADCTGHLFFVFFSLNGLSAWLAPHMDTEGDGSLAQLRTVQQLLLVSNEDLTVTDCSSYLRCCCHLRNSSVMTLSKPQ